MGIDTNCIEYKGINKPNCDCNDLITFKEFSVSEMLQVPDSNYDINYILKVSSNLNILNKKIFKTPISTSAEGQVLTGLKLGVEGEINTSITYVSNTDEQSLSVINYKSKLYISTPIPNYINSVQSIEPNLYIESVNIEQLSEKLLSENFILLLTVE